MAQGDGNPGMNRLAQAMNERMRQFHDDITGDLKIDFGTIGSDWSLRPNSFPKPIPKGDYEVCKWLTGVSVKTSSSSGHTHSVTMPKLKKGDRVLLVWVQNEVCVVDVIVPSSKL